MRYLAFMRFLLPLLCILLTTACGGRSISNGHARDAILKIPQSELNDKDVNVAKVSMIGGSEAVVETQLKTAFRLEKSDGKWVVREVRIGHSQWEKVDNLAMALQAVKTSETREMLSQIAEAIRKYRENTGNLPAFKDYVALSDRLSPRFMTPLIRLDSWRQPLEATQPDAGTILLRSAGPDGVMNSSDDILLNVTR